MRVYLGGLQPSQRHEIDREFGKRAEIRFLDNDLDVAGWRSALSGVYDLLIVGQRIAGSKRTQDVPKSKLVVLPTGSLTAFREALNARLPPEEKTWQRKTPIEATPEPEPEPEPAPTPEPMMTAPSAAPSSGDAAEPRQSVAGEILEHLRRQAVGFEFTLHHLLHIFPEATINSIGAGIDTIQRHGGVEVCGEEPSPKRPSMKVRKFKTTDKINGHIPVRRVGVYGAGKPKPNGANGHTNGNGHAPVVTAVPENLSREERVKRLVGNVLDLIKDTNAEMEEAMKQHYLALKTNQQSFQDKALAILGEMEEIATEGTNLMHIPITKLHDAWVAREPEWKAMHNKPKATELPSWLKPA